MGVQVNQKVLDGSGAIIQEIQGEGLSLTGRELLEFEAASVDVTSLSSDGLYLIKDSTNGDSAFLKVTSTGLTPAITKDSGSAVITVVKDTAASINVYFEDDVIKVQNLTGGTIDLSLKSYT